MRKIETLPEELVFVMSDGHQGARSCMLELMFYDENAVENLLFLYEHGIYGEKLYKLWRDCCFKNTNILKKTINAFQRGEFSKERINENLSSLYARPFVFN